MTEAGQGSGPAGLPEAGRYALRYAALGWPVVPLHSMRGARCSCGKACASPGKHPRTQNGLKEASTDAPVVRRWWEEWRDANVGVVTGPAAGIWVLDVDAKAGGLESLAALEARHGPLPDAPVAMTGGGGRHYVFAYPTGGARSRVNLFKGDGLPGIDSRGAGGYIVVEPSVHASGRQYAWDAEADPLEGAAPAQAPAWLLERVCSPPEAVRAGEAWQGGKGLSDQERARLADALPYLDADDRETWVQAGMALHATGAEDAFDLWDAWARASDKHDAADARRVWDSFRPEGQGRPLRLSYIFAEAKRRGWVPVRLARGDGAAAVVPGDPDWRDALRRNDKGNVTACLDNVVTVMEMHPELQGLLAYCEFSYNVVKTRAPPWGTSEPGDWEDADRAKLRAWFARHTPLTPAHQDLTDALLTIAHRQRVHPVREFLEGQEWDGEDRLHRWLFDAFGAQAVGVTADERAYLSAAGAKFLVGAVARVMRPGCKNDSVLILEGPQGRGKSSAVEMLFGHRWFTDAPLELGEKDAYLSIRGKWGVEMAELGSFNRAESTTAKAFFSQRTDRYRPPYGQQVGEWKRQCAFVGSTNLREYLKDYTGNRRYWPVYVHRLDVGWLRANRGQLWAEAVARFREGTPWWVDSADAGELRLFETQQEDRMQGDPWESLLAQFVAARTGFVSTSELLTEGLGLEPRHIQKAHTERISQIMQHMGWEPDRGRVNGVQLRGYSRATGGGR